MIMVFIGVIWVDPRVTKVDPSNACVELEFPSLHLFYSLLDELNVFQDLEET